MNRQIVVELSAQLQGHATNMSPLAQKFVDECAMQHGMYAAMGGVIMLAFLSIAVWLFYLSTRPESDAPLEKQLTGWILCLASVGMFVFSVIQLASALTPTLTLAREL